MSSRLISVLQNYYPLFLEGVWGTLWISAVVVLLGSLLGGLFALGKMSSKKFITVPVNLLTEIIRGTPILLQLFFFSFGLSQISPIAFKEEIWIILALILNSSAYVAEVIRSGINAVNKGQFEAAKSLGLSNKDMMVKIILPQAVKNILPALGNEFIMMVKETSLAAFFFIPSLMTSESIVSGITYARTETLIITGLLYLMITVPLSQLVQRYERKLAQNDK